MSLTPDLEQLRQVAEAGFSDRCRITRDPEGAVDDVLDRTTGKLVPPSPDATTVYEGVCALLPALGEYSRREGERDAYRRRWRARLPLSAPAPKGGDRLEVLEAARDSSLVGRRFVIQARNVNTFAVSRQLFLEDEEGVTVRN